MKKTNWRENMAGLVRVLTLAHMSLLPNLPNSWPQEFFMTPQFHNSRLNCEASFYWCFFKNCKQSCDKGHGAPRLACRPCWKRSKCWLSSFQDSSYSSCVDGRHKCHVPSSTHCLQAKEMGVISVFQQVLCTFSKCPSSPDNIWTLKGEEEEVSDGRRFSAIKRFYFCCGAV